MKNENRMLMKCLLLLLLLMVGGVSEMWAATYKYRLLNADNKLVAYCENTAFGIPNNMKSPLVSEYTYYKTGTDEDNDGVYDVSEAITNLTGINDGDYIYVKYTLNSTGKELFTGGQYKVYTNMQSGKYLAFANGGNVGAWNSQGSGNNIWNIEGDPYTLKLKVANNEVNNSTDRGKYMSAASLTNNVNCQVSSTNTYNKFMVVGASNDATKMILRINEAEGEYTSSYGGYCNGGNPVQIWRNLQSGGDNYNHVNNNWFRFEKQEVKCTYKVISRKYGHLAVTTLPTVVGAKLALPAKYCSPMLTAEDYHYWAESDVTKSTATYEGTSKKYDKYTVKGNTTELTKAPDEDAVIYVTYDWETSWASLAGLTHGGAYNIKHGDYVMYQDTWNGEANGKFSNSIDTDNITTIWQFDLTDPYAILVKAVNKGENGYLTYGGNYGDVREYDLAKAKGKDFWSYILVNGTTGTYRLMVGNNLFTDTSKNNSNAGYLRREDTNPRFHYNGDPENQSNLTFTRQSIATYKVISRTYGHIAVSTSYFVFHDTPQLPAKYQSAMLLTSDYHYWAEDNVANSAGTYTVKDANKELTTLPAGNYDLYVTYDWDVANASRAGLVHLASYNIIESSGHDSENDKDYYLWQDDGNQGQGQFSQMANTNASKSQAKALWELDLTDPYAIQVKSVSKGDNGYFCTLSGFGNTRLRNLTTAKRDGNFWSFILVNGAKSGTYSLMVGNNQFNDASKNNSNGGYLWRQTTAARCGYAEQVDDYHNIMFTQPELTYTYHIIDREGREAIKYTAKQTPHITIDYAHLPAAIRSPYLQGETLTAYTSASSNGTAEDGRTKYTLSGAITATPAEDADIYVTYTTTLLTKKPLHLRGARGFNIEINGRYIGDNGSKGSGTHSTSEIEDTDPRFIWYVKGGAMHDPYAVEVENLATQNYLIHNTGTPGLSLSTAAANRYFILMQYADHEIEGDETKIRVELMAATGADLGGDTPSDYYSVGRTAEGVQGATLMSGSTVEHGDDRLKLLLNVAHSTVQYHVIDLQNKIVTESEVLTVSEGENDEVMLPITLQSPMVKTYHYWHQIDFAIEGDTYTLKSGKRTKVNDEDYGDEVESVAEASGHIYVTYNDGLKTSTDEGYLDLTGSQNRNVDGKMYLLRFADGTSFRQENGDGFEDEAKPPIYAYNNGESGLFVYGQHKFDAQTAGAASTRTRWAWYLEAVDETTPDPYHVKIASLQQKMDGVDATHYSYLRTYKPDGYGRVVTNVIVKDNSEVAEAGIEASEYMILYGTNGHSRLVTTQPVDGQQRAVNTLEQYWKNNPTALNIIKEKYPELSGAPTDAQKTAALVTGMGWHTYKNYAYGTTFTSTSKTWGNDEHWYLTVGVGTSNGDGTFNGDLDIVELNLDAALVLIDNHGWEVMRKPIARTGSSNKAARDAAIKVYDSPMVERYHFWTNYDKVPGYHKYKPHTGDASASKNAKDNGTAPSLASYPQVVSGGVLADLYVTYDVKAGYADTYTGASTETAVKTSRFLVRQGGKYAKATNASTLTSATEADNLGTDSPFYWLLKPNFNIDQEMGYEYEGSNNEANKATTDQTNYDEGRNGFDPYNLQLQNSLYKTYMTTSATDALLNVGGGWETSTAAGYAVTLSEKVNRQFTATGYDNKECQVTNQTFMAVQDANGNLRLMPRFDHEHVMQGFATLQPLAEAQSAGDVTHVQTTLFTVPTTYHIIDNAGTEALRMTVADGLGLTVPAAISSPLVKNYYYHSTLEHARDHRTSGNLSQMPQDIYVSYDFDASKGVKLGNKQYYVQIGGQYVHTDGTAAKGAASKVENDNAYIWRLYTDSSDPYCLTLAPPVSGSDPTPSAWLNAASLPALGAAANVESGTGTVVNRFCLLNGNGTNGNYVLAAASGDGFATAPYAYLSCSGADSNIQLVHASGTTNTTDAVQVKLTPINVTYEYRVINLSGNIAITAKTTDCAPGDHPEIPKSIKSPLAKDFRYYTPTEILETEGTDAYGLFALNCTFQEDKTAADSITIVPADNTQPIYVTYTYNNDESEIDLSGRGAYNFELTPFSNNGNVNYGDFFMYYTDSDWTAADWKEVSKDGQDQSTRNKVSISRNHSISIWYMKGSDPYNIRIGNRYVNELLTRDGKISTNEDGGDILPNLEYTITEGANDVAKKSGWVITENKDSYTNSRLRTTSQLKDKNHQIRSLILLEGNEGYDEHYRFMAALPRQTKNTDDTGFRDSEHDYYFFLGKRPTNDGSGAFHRSDNIASWPRERQSVTNIRLVPKNLIDVVFHLKHQVTGVEQKTQKETYVAKAAITLPDVLNRKYCTYTYRSKYNVNGDAADGATDSDDDAQNTLTNYPLVVDEESAENPEVHIYVDYTVNDAAIPFQRLATTKEGIKALTKTDFDIRTVAQQTANKNHLYYMVLDTNDDFTGGQQYFLRSGGTASEAEGYVDWMNNSYRLHKDEEDNLNQWTYNRLAQSYRPNDHAMFQEETWLWAFAGDPYDLYVYNLAAVTEKVQNPITKEITYTYHPDHYMGYDAEALRVTTPAYGAAALTATPWGLAPANGSDADGIFSLVTAIDTDGDGYADKPVSWQMNSNRVTLTQRTGNATSWNLKLLPYEPVLFEDVNLTVRREDEVAAYEAGTKQLDEMTTGISRMFFAAEERMFVAGDQITMANMPTEVKRKFCKYTFYGGSTAAPFTVPGGAYTVQAGPYRYQWVGTYDSDGNKVYNYKYDLTDNEEEPQSLPQTVYASYEVTSDIFLKEEPDEDELAKMINNNDHIYFMDFTKGLSNLGYNYGAHAYFDEEATFETQLKGMMTDQKTYNTTTTKWETSGNYSDCQFKTTTDRMTQMPENLKWYFVGDPYAVRVFCTKERGKNLARFNEEETAWQFITDCVHLRKSPAEPVDDRENIYYYDVYGKQLTDKPVHNPNYNKPYYPEFYWEVVPAASELDDAFALRFRADNTLLGYQGVYYYLVPDGTKRTYRYRETADGEEKERSFNINLNYYEDNDPQESGNYVGYHKANDQNAVIRLVQPAKVYVTAYSATDESDPKSPVVVDELSEYFGVDELLRDVPRHLKRKFVSYENLRYVQKDKTIDTKEDLLTKATSSSFNFTLSKDRAFDYEDCSAHTGKVFKDGAITNPTFKLLVDYRLDSDGERMFTTTASSSSTDEVTWLDLKLADYKDDDGGWSRNSWMYYDKSNTTTSSDWLVSDFTQTDANDSSDKNAAWNTGLKGLHWAFIGDPYNFTVLNRRLFDNGATYQWLGTAVEDGTTYLRLQGDNTQGAEYGNTEWSLIYCKTGDDSNYFLRTSTRKQSLDDYAAENPSNETNAYQYVIYQKYSSGDVTKAYYQLADFSLEKTDGYIDQAEIRTATVVDDDDADNDCFDADIYVYNLTSSTPKASKLNAELMYGDAIKNMPLTLQRYGCSYRCFINYNSTTHTGTQVTELNDETLDGATKNPETGHIIISYVYTVHDDVASFFTTADDAKNDQYIWASANFQWQQTYKGNKTEYTDYETYIAGYRTNAAGLVVGVIYGTRPVVKKSDGQDITVDSYGWLNSHSSSDQAFGDDRQQNDDDDDQKWAFVGDPYDFQMQNYTKYLANPTSALTSGIDFSLTESSSWALAVGKNGDYYLALIDDDGNILKYVTFDRSTEQSDLPSDQQYLKLTGGLPTNDPTGNHYNADGVKTFHLANLKNYASYVIYHLVIAHQHSADYEDTFDELNFTEEQKLTARRKIRKRLAEWLKYNASDAVRDKYLKKDAYTFNYQDSKSEGINGTYYITDDINNEYIVQSGDKEGELTGDIKTDLPPLLTGTSLRDVVNYPVENFTVEQVGIGNVLSVPWYMKRQFCKYTLYQRDVLRTENDTSNPVKNDDGLFLWSNETTGEVRYAADSPGDDWIQIYNTKWQSVTKAKSGGSYADDKTQVESENGQIIKKLNSTHKNRMVLVDVVYEVDPKEFRFSDQGRNTTAWYSMMTNNENDGLMNFSYKDGIGARPDRTQHYTNNYLWAAVGDPYGFVLHNRYATINGTGWDNVVVTTLGELPQKATVDYINTVSDIDGDGVYETESKARTEAATYTGTAADARFVNRRIVHLGRGGKRTGYSEETKNDPQYTVQTYGAHNAVYEMYMGDLPHSFLMHPTAAHVNTEGDKFGSFYMVHKPKTGTSELEYSADVSALRTDPDANWRMVTTPDQLLPYFDRASYVGGLKTTVANRAANRSYYNRLNEYKTIWDGGDLTLLPDDYFATMDNIRKLVYSGKFTTSDGKEIKPETPRPSAALGNASLLPLKFVSDNLVPMQQGYYRLVAFSQKGLDKDAENAYGDNVHGIQGPRYISGYRFLSEADYSGNKLDKGSRWLHFYETDEAHSTFQTFGELNDKIGTLDVHHDRSIAPHPAMRGNIEILPAEYDPSSIFYFAPVAGDQFERYTFGTQGLRVFARAGGVQPGGAGKYGTAIPESEEAYGQTKLVDEDSVKEAAIVSQLTKDGFSDSIRLADIGGAAVTLRTMKYDLGANKHLGEGDGNKDAQTWDDIVGPNLKTNYLCIDANHRYRVTIHTNNEMMEIGDTYDSEGHWSGYGIQDTKWLLQPVGVQTEWPYNQLPLRLEVQKGDKVSGTDDDYYYYASTYLPFDSRLSSTVDAAFTLDAAPKESSTAGEQNITLRAVGQLNNMGNPQFIPAGWPVIVRTSSPKTGTVPSVSGKESGKEDTPRHYVELFLPTNTPTTISEGKDKIDAAGLRGSYLERTLTGSEVGTITDNTATEEGGYYSTSKAVMVFGQPFSQEGGVNNTKTGAQSYYTHAENTTPGFYTNENWWRGHYDETMVSATSNDGTLSTAFLANSHGTDTATKQQRSNLYVYHNKVYYLYTIGSGEGEAPRYIKVRFDGDPEVEMPDEQPEEEEEETLEDGLTHQTPWPCDVYDLTGRKVATHETPQTLRQNNPGLPKGVYIFGHRKVVVK